MSHSSLPAQQPTAYDLWFLPLGGTGEIGMNMNLYGHAGQWLMVDCGMGFEHSSLGEKRVAADPSYIEQHRHRLQAIVITHAHEDHIGAIATLWPRLKAPIYATPFALEVLFNKLSEVTWGHAVPVHKITPKESYNIGEFEVTWLPMPHSIPEACSVLIDTLAGKVLHTGDWKIDPNPVIGNAFNHALYANLRHLPIDAMVCDATNANKPAATPSESACYPGLYQTIKHAPQRVVVSCFSSNIARLITLARIAQQTERHFAVFGRSLQNMVSIARRLGYWPEQLKIIEPSHIGYLPPEEVLVVATGSQGEPRAALTQLARQRHRWLNIEAGDTVIFSANKIPSNKIRIEQLIAQLKQIAITVIHAEDVPSDQPPLHASGHPGQENVRTLLDLVQPNLLIPTHGEPEHLEALSMLAEKASIRHVVQGSNGDLFKLAPFIKHEPNWAKTDVIHLPQQ